MAWEHNENSNFPLIKGSKDYKVQKDDPSYWGVQLDDQQSACELNRYDEGIIPLL